MNKLHYSIALRHVILFYKNLFSVIHFRKQDNVETTTLMVERDGLYDVSVHKMLSESELKPETVFECLLTIPGTSYAAREETMYFPGKGERFFLPGVDPTKLFFIVKHIFYLFLLLNFVILLYMH